MMTQADIKKKSKSFEKWYQPIELLPDFWTRPRNNRKYDYIRRVMQGCERQRVFDLGCNSGLLSLLAARGGATDVIGIDKRKYAIEQATFVQSVWLGLGYPVQKVSFWNDDVFNQLDLLKDRDLLVACCVLYHMGPDVHKFMDAVTKSPIRIMIMQGNINREKKITNPHQDFGNNLCNLDGMGKLATRHGWKFRRAAGTSFPVVIADKITKP